MRPRFVPAVLLAALLAGGGLTGCGGGEAPADNPPPTTAGSIPPDTSAARSDLAAIAALAKDFRYSALYDYDAQDGQGVRSVVATVANDGSWRVDVPGGALGGGVDVSIVQTAEGVFQCTLPTVANPVSPSCVRVADTGRRVPKEFDPRVQRVFRQWLSVFQDRQSPLSVVAAQPLPGAQSGVAQGRCFSVDTISASMKAPVDIGIYCFADTGMLTAARVGFGTLTLVSVAAAPARIDLPGPITGSPALQTKSPPPPPEPSFTPSTNVSGAAG